MANIIPLKDNTGAQFYPQTHEKAVVDSNGVNLQTKLASITTPTYVTAWDGASTPVVANIPAGVSVTYNTTTYTGTLAASASTANKTYLVSTGTTDNYNRYVTQLNGSTYSWQNLGSTEIDLSDYATKEELGQLDQEVNGLFRDTVSDYAIADEKGNNLVEFAKGHLKTKNFDSETAPICEDLIPAENDAAADLIFSDENENVLLELAGGNIRTKNFDSSKLPVKAIRRAVFMGDSITQGVYSYWNNGGHAETDRYNGFDLVSMTDVAEATAYHGIHYYFGLLSGAKMKNLGKRGTGWVADTRNIGNALAVANAYSFKNTDFVALCFGVNDYIQGKTVGDITTKVIGTVIGNMSATIEKILADNPLCKVVVYSPYNTWGQVSYGGDYTSNVLYGDENTNYALGYAINGNSLQDIINAMEDVCMHYGIQIVNLSKGNVINRFTIKNILVDGLHPTKESYIKLAAEIYGKGNFGA